MQYKKKNINLAKQMADEIELEQALRGTKKQEPKKTVQRIFVNSTRQERYESAVIPRASSPAIFEVSKPRPVQKQPISQLMGQTKDFKSLNQLKY